MLNVALSAVLILFSSRLFAATLETPAEGLTKVIVSLVQAKIEVKEIKSAKSLKVSISGPAAEAVLLERKEDRVELRLKTAASKDMFNELADLQITLYVPPVNLELFLYEGQIDLQGLSQTVLARNLKGKISSKDGTAALQLSLQKGEITVSSHLGSLKIDSQKASVNLSKIQGDILLENFAGDSNLDDCKGQLRLKTATGATRIARSSGSLQFEVGRGLLSSNDFVGRTDGEIQEATVNLTLSPDSDMNLKNQNGKVTITNNPQASPSVNVSVEEGDLFVPSYLKVNREGNQKSVRGRLRGGAGGGGLVLRSVEGIVTLR